MTREEFEANPANSVPDTAKYLGLGRNQIYDAVKRGEIPALRIGNRILVPTERLRAMLEGSRAA